MKIYNLEEIIVKSAHHIERNTLASHFDDEVYSNRDECLKLFKSFVKQMKETDTDYKNCKPECIIDEEDTFKFWEDGNYADNHYSMCIRGLILKEDN